MVSRESVPFSIELDSILGSGGIGSAGASRPFFVVVLEDERVEIEKRPLAFGADATRRMKRDADAPIDFGESGPLLPVCRDMECGVAKEAWDGLAVWDFVREPGLRERAVLCFSDFVRFLVRADGVTESASVDMGSCCW